MADALSFLNASLAGLGNPVAMGISIILSILAGGIVILLIVGLLSKYFHEYAISPVNAFKVSATATVVNLLGVVPLLSGLLSSVPGAGILAILMPMLVWIVMIKFFFSKVRTMHAAVMGIACWFASGSLTPVLVSVIRSFLPF